MAKRKEVEPTMPKPIVPVSQDNGANSIRELNRALSLARMEAMGELQNKFCALVNEAKLPWQDVYIILEEVKRQAYEGFERQLKRE